VRARERLKGQIRVVLRLVLLGSFTVKKWNILRKEERKNEKKKKKKRGQR